MEGEVSDGALGKANEADPQSTNRVVQRRAKRGLCGGVKKSASAKGRRRVRAAQRGAVVVVMRMRIVFAGVGRRLCTAVRK